MGFQFQELDINKISVIGAGQIGPDIAFHFAQNLAGHHVKIVVEDVSYQSLEKAHQRIEKRIDHLIGRGIIDNEKADSIRESISFSMNIQDIAESDIILETATENPSIKNSIFKQLDNLNNSRCLKLSNSSYIKPETIFKDIKHPEHAMVVHYFYPADQNSALEIIPTNQTDPKVTQSLIDFYRFLNKEPLFVKSSYGYAIDPIFGGLCQIALYCVEKGFGSVKQIDQIFKDILGLHFGPFTILNLSGGNPILDHGLDEMKKHLSPWFSSPKKLSEHVIDQESWDVASPNEEVQVPESTKEEVADLVLGGYFALVSFIADREICDINDLNRICSHALSIKAPFDLMNRIGIHKTMDLIDKFKEQQPEFEVPEILRTVLDQGAWQGIDPVD